MVRLVPWKPLSVMVDPDTADTTPNSACWMMSTNAAVGVGADVSVADDDPVELVDEEDGEVVDVLEGAVVEVDAGVVVGVVVVVGRGWWWRTSDTTTSSPTVTPLGETGEPVSKYLVEELVATSIDVPPGSERVNPSADTAVTLPRRMWGDGLRWVAAPAMP